MNTTFEKIESLYTTRYKIHNIYYCETTNSLTLETWRKDVYNIQQSLLRQFDNIYVFVVRDIFKYAHIVINMKG